MKICGQTFKIADTFDTPITVPDCMVIGQNKIGKGNGEAKLYISSKDKMREFYGGEGFVAKCFILKQDLISYMKAMKGEYLHPSQNYRGKDDFKTLWQSRMDAIAQMDEVIEFNITDQTQIAGPRGYINSTDEGYKVIRELSLPLVSYISTMQLTDKSGSTLYYWKLFADFEAIADKSTATVFQYGKKEEAKAEPIQPKQDKKKEQLRQSRIGQGLYREKLLEECPYCPITRINDERLLIASHIKPWAVSNDKERIDPKNGFMLSPLYDKLFDSGLMTFTDDRHIILSNWLSPQNQKRITLPKDNFVQMLPIDEFRKNYLAYHREMVFKG